MESSTQYMHDWQPARVLTEWLVVWLQRRPGDLTVRVYADPVREWGKSKWHGELLSKGNTNRNWAVDLQLFRCSFNTTELSEKFVRYQRVGEPIAEVWIGTRFKAVGRTVRMRNLYVIIHSLSSFYFDWLRVSCFGNRTALFVESVSLWIQI